MQNYQNFCLSFEQQYFCCCYCPKLYTDIILMFISVITKNTQLYLTYNHDQCQVEQISQSHWQVSTLNTVRWRSQSLRWRSQSLRWRSWTVKWRSWLQVKVTPVAEQLHHEAKKRPTVGKSKKQRKVHHGRHKVGMICLTIFNYPTMHNNKECAN